MGHNISKLELFPSSVPIFIPSELVQRLINILTCLYVRMLHDMIYDINGLRGLEVACWPLVPKFAGSNPAEAVGFLRAKKSSARLSSKGK
jgi:hypothetical protein